MMDRHPRVLAVDDESLIRMSLRIALVREGCIVDTAGSGVEAMALVDRHRYDLILLDLRLPDVSGMDVLRHAKKVAPSTKVLLVTASTNAPTAAEAAQEGAVGVVMKPFTLQSIAATTRSLVAREGVAGIVTREGDPL